MAYSRASINDIFNQNELENAHLLSAFEMRSCYIEEYGNS